MRIFDGVFGKVQECRNFWHSCSVSMWSVSLTCLLLFLPSASSLKFLCFSPRTATSHVNFLGKLSDALVDAGHEVVILSTIVDSSMKSAGSDRARVIEVPPDEAGIQFELAMPSDYIDTWSSGETWQALPSWASKTDHWVAQCNATIKYPGLLKQLREEKFDAAFGESMNLCMGGIFHLAGIDKFAVTESIAYKDGMYHFSQVPTLPSYVPSIMGGSFGEDMTFLQRAFNLFNMIMFADHNYASAPKYQKVFESHSPGFPDVIVLMAANSLFFLNSDPLVDFPRPSAARMIDIGGIAVPSSLKKMSQKWSDILDLRPKTVFMSFGTFAKAYVMPEEYKETIRATARALPNVTFIWKYEKPEHNVTQGIHNLIETTWIPQNDLLRDARLSAFVTHCGQGSITEANYAGVPLIAVPVIFDQVRNAFQVKRNGLGINLDKSDLGSPGKLEEAIREVLENPEYMLRAKATTAMLSNKPFTASEVFTRNMEFLARHGPLRQLDHYGKHLNFWKFYLIDIIVVFILIAIFAISLAMYILVKLLAICRGNRVRKAKEE